MEYLKTKHPCLVVLVLFLISVPFRFAAMTSGVLPLAIIGDGIFIIAIVLGIVLIALRLKARRQIIGYCETCGKPYMNDKEQTEHAFSHR